MIYWKRYSVNGHFMDWKSRTVGYLQLNTNGLLY